MERIKFIYILNLSDSLRSRKRIWDSPLYNKRARVKILGDRPLPILTAKQPSSYTELRRVESFEASTRYEWTEGRTTNFSVRHLTATNRKRPHQDQGFSGDLSNRKARVRIPSLNTLFL